MDNAAAWWAGGSLFFALLGDVLLVGLLAFSPFSCWCLFFPLEVDAPDESSNPTTACIPPSLLDRVIRTTEPRGCSCLGRCEVLRCFVLCQVLFVVAPGGPALARELELSREATEPLERVELLTKASRLRKATGSTSVAVSGSQSSSQNICAYRAVLKLSRGTNDALGFAKPKPRTPPAGAVAGGTGTEGGIVSCVCRVSTAMRSLLLLLWGRSFAAAAAAAAAAAVVGSAVAEPRSICCRKATRSSSRNTPWSSS
mmetsp:Transcript_50979/g.108284  ORF Transcript_50979/g.108284 Transcript_50979/m.108284 type:complete len:256 (+) Transcript_50979:178-945(+)